MQNVAATRRPSQGKYAYVGNRPAYKERDWASELWQATKHIPKDSILFQDKIYPVCASCTRRYLPQLGCLWCTRYGLKTNKPA